MFSLRAASLLFGAGEHYTEQKSVFEPPVAKKIIFRVKTISFFRRKRCGRYITHEIVQQSGSSWYKSVVLWLVFILKL